MPVLPHTILQDSFSFLVFSRNLPADNLSWNYENNLTFQILCDRSSIQRILLVWLEHYSQLAESYPVAISPREGSMKPIGTSVLFTALGCDSKELAQRVLDEPGIRGLISEGKFLVSQQGITFPVDQILWDSETIPIDISELFSKFESKDDAHLLLDLFMQHTPTRIIQLEDAIAEKNQQEAHRLAHSIKGGALNVCATDLASVAKQLELELKHHGFTEKIAEMLSLLKKQYGNVDNYWSSLEEE
jgi:HPt (histidine-containing phosphotransfer) domain-containing protein